MKARKDRLDKLLVDRGLAETRARARAYIMAGEVRVNGERVDKAGTQVAVDSRIEVAAPLPYVSRGGYKLAGAIDHFGIHVEERVCADAGSSTGGFTDVLLQAGARRVYAIDVGQGQLHWKLRQDERVIVRERTNARYLESLPELIDLVVIDVSFISLKLILPAVGKWLATGADVIALIKPQFEAGPEWVGKGGIVRDPAVRREVLLDVLSWAQANEWKPMGLMQSPIQGADGNIEYLAWFQRGKSSQDIVHLVHPLSLGVD